MNFKVRHTRLFLRRLLIVLLLVSPSIFILSGQKTVTIAFLTDLHVNPKSASDTNLARIVDEINKTKIDFIVVAGDLTNTGSDAELVAVKRSLDRLIMPCHVLPGNHETNWSESAGLTVNKFWVDDRFYFKYDNFIFAGFNTGPFMRMGDGLVKQEDLQWLKRRLSGLNSDENVLISFSHYPLSDGLSNWPEITNILKSAGCRISFCGHGHRLSLYNFNGIPGIMGRAVLTGNSTVPGYNIIKIKGDSLFVFNKVLGEVIVKPAIQLNYIKPDTLSALPVSPLPDYSMNLIKGIKTTTLINDTASIFTGPCIVNDTTIIYCNSAGWIKAINAISGRMIWKTRIAGPVYSTPVNCGGIVVLGSVDGSIIGINAADGKVVWNVNTGRPVLAEAIFDGDFVYIGGGDISFYKIDGVNGKIVWQYNEVGDLIQGAPALSGNNVIFGAWDRHLYCLDKNSGTLKWKWNNGKPQKLYSPGNIYPVYSGNKVFIVAPDRYMTALDLETGKEIWRTNRHQVRESMGISPDGSLVYAKLMNDTVIAVSAYEDFPLTKWTVDAGFGYEHNPCPLLATENSVIAGTRSGVVVAIDPDTKQVKWRYKAGNSSVNKVVTDSRGNYWLTLMEGKVIYIETTENE